jgi:WD40 repeat protein
MDNISRFPSRDREGALFWEAVMRSAKRVSSGGAGFHPADRASALSRISSGPAAEGCGNTRLRLLGSHRRHRQFARWLPYCLLGVAFGTPAFLTAQTDEFPSKPFPRIETEMHSAVIRRIAVDTGEHFVVTASDDKTARVWDLRNGNLLRILRPPQGDGDVGKLYAVAISPDGATVVLGGYTRASGTTIWLFDRASGNLIRQINGFPDVVQHLSYSQNGRYLAAGLGSNGIRIYRTSDYQEAARDTQYEDGVYWVDFDRTGRLVTASYDGSVRLYASDFRLLQKKQAPGGKRPFSGRFSPDASKVAVGFADSTAVNVLSGQDLSLLYAPNTTQVTSGSLSTIAWSRVGQLLYGAGTYGQPLSRVLRWTNAGQGPVRLWPVTPSTIMDLTALSDSRLAFGSQDPAVGVLNSDGQMAWRHTQESLDLRRTELGLRLSPAGDIVVFGRWNLDTRDTLIQRKAHFSIPDRKFRFDPPDDASLQPARTTGLNIADWKDTEKPTLNGRALDLYAHEMSRSLAISANADSFLLGTEFWLRLFDRQGKQRWNTAVPSAAWDVNLTQDGRYAVGALGDGTIRWYEAATGKEVLAVFVHKDGQRWVAWTPDGFYDASPGGDSLFGYHLNQGANQAGEFVKVDQVRDLFYRQDLIAHRLKPDGAQAIQAALKNVPDIRTVLAGGLPPELELVSQSQSESQGEFDLQFRVKSARGGTGRVVYRVDGAEIEGREPGILLPGSVTQNHHFDLSPGRHEVAVTVFNAKNQVESRSIASIVNVTAPTLTPSLYVVAAGISNYRDHDLNEGVKYAAADAKTVIDRLTQQSRGLFDRVIPYPLYDDQATRTGIQQAVGKVASVIKPADVFVLYLAGHGTASDGNYYFIPWEVRYTSNDALLKESLDQESLRKLLAQIPAKKTLVLLDTCGSAAFSQEGRDPLSQKGAIDRFAKITGRATLAAAAQTALEGVENHGVFTYAVLEALSKAADPSSGFVEVTRLADYVVDAVPQITKQRFGYEQIPMWIFQGQTFPIARKP